MSEKEKQIKEDEIDLIELIKSVWAKRRFIIKITSIFIFLGLFVALTSKSEYEASCKLLPEGQEKGTDFGGLGGLAGLAGFDLSGLGATGVLSPDLYPEIVNSAPFMLKLINSPVYFEQEDTTISSFEYFKEINRPSLISLIGDYTIGLPGKIKGLFNSSEGVVVKDYDLLRFTAEDWRIIEHYKSRINILVDPKTGIIGITSEMPDPVAAAKIVDIVVKELTERVTVYKTGKTQISLDFIQERFLEAKETYEATQRKVAGFTDRNRNLTNPIIQTEYERLQNELNIAFEVYKGLATQLEQTKIKVKEETPVFTVLEPVKIPSDKSKPKRKIIIVFFSFIGVVVSSGIVIIKELINK